MLKFIYRGSREIQSPAKAGGSASREVTADGQLFLLVYGGSQACAGPGVSFLCSFAAASSWAGLGP